MILAGAPSSPYAGYAAISPIGNTIGALICFFGLGFLPILIVSLILNAFGQLRVPREAEILGLDFVGEEAYEAIRDNLDLERWFRLPKSHERRIHGHRHAGIRLVLEGPTLVPALDAHAAHPGPFSVDDLLHYRTAREPPCQTEARNRRTIMRKARSKKKRPLLLAELERRYRETPEF